MVCTVRIGLMFLLILSIYKNSYADNAAVCDVQKLSQAVADTNGELKKLQAENTKTFQQKLVALKKKKGWSDKEFVSKAAPFVKNAKITEFDVKYQELLSSIPKLAKQTDEPVKPDCILLVQLHSQLKEIMKVSEQKWAYMFGQVDGALKN